MVLLELKAGQFAVTEEGLAVLGLSDSSFRPIDSEYNPNVVHIANGIGCFGFKQKCRVVTAEEAFEVAKKWLAE